jgi:hypothetical protein
MMTIIHQKEETVARLCFSRAIGQGEKPRRGRDF